MQPNKPLGELLYLLHGVGTSAPVHLEIDGRKVQAAIGATVLQTADAAGIRIPRLCHLPGTPARPVCQLCLISIEGRNGLVNACSTPVHAGMVVTTRNAEIDAMRRTIMELTLLEHGRCGKPDCEVEALAERLGVTASPAEALPREPAPCCASDYIGFDRTLCVLCDRCIRVCHLQIPNRSGRGVADVISFDGCASPADSRCDACGDCVAACPSGALYAPATKR